MHTYTMRRIPFADIQAIELDWVRLSQGKDMTYHQAYGWYNMLVGFTPVNKHIDCVLYMVERDGEAVLIAPLWIIKSRFRLANARGVYLIGRRSFTDYLNLIYREFDPEAFDVLVKNVHATYGNLPWYLEQLKESTDLYAHLLKLKEQGRLKLKTSTPSECAMLSLPEAADVYSASLSKNTRQNLRTAANRARKDGVEFIVKTDDKDIDPAVCVACRDAWAERRRRRRGDGLSWKGRLYLGAKHLLHDRFLIDYPSYLPMIDDKDSHLLTITDAAEGTLAAFFCYGLDLAHHQIFVMTAGVNESYAKYSPGMLSMHQLITQSISEGHITTIDFTRGNERYKYHLGAKPHYIYNLCVRFTD